MPSRKEFEDMGTMYINGKYCSATIFTTNNYPIEDYAIAQLKSLCNNIVSDGCCMRIMPDVHPGKVGTIGLTMTVGNKIMPNVVGIDIGCGMTLAGIKGKTKDFKKLDTVIRENIPTGFRIRESIHHYMDNFDLSELYCFRHINTPKALLAAGSLGSGNHFIEVDKDDEGNHFLVVHSGSRRLGKEVTEYYLNEGQKLLKSQGINLPYELTYIDGELKDKYIHDLTVVQSYASVSRNIIIAEICKGMKWKVSDTYSCIHNYIDTSASVTYIFGAPMIRKGAISALKGEKVIIPVNMRDGIILGTGLGNKEWNYSAPHGSGRIMKREDVKSNYTLSAYKKEMKGIYSDCINKDTLDEAPFAYRDIESIRNILTDTITIDKIIKPVYNYHSVNKQ